MARSGLETRNQILDAAERLFLHQGYGGTSVDTILEHTGVTKGAFFHHFESKHALAHALLDRYATHDREQFDQFVQRAERLSRDPLQQVLIIVGLYEEMMEQLNEPFPGCLFAAYAYQAGLFSDSIHDVIRASLLLWRDVIGDKLLQAIDQHPQRIPVEAGELADTGLAILEGAFILSKTFNEPKLVGYQLRHYRNYLELVFGQI